MLLKWIDYNVLLRSIIWTLPLFLNCSGPALPVAQAQTIAFQGFKGSQLTCMFGKLFQKIISIPVLWNIAHKQPVIVKRYGYANLFSFPYLIIIQLQEQWKGSQLCLGQRGGEGLWVWRKGLSPPGSRPPLATDALYLLIYQTLPVSPLCLSTLVCFRRKDVDLER